MNVSGRYIPLETTAPPFVQMSTYPNYDDDDHDNWAILLYPEPTQSTPPTYTPPSMFPPKNENDKGNTDQNDNEKGKFATFTVVTKSTRDNWPNHLL